MAKNIDKKFKRDFLHGLQKAISLFLSEPIDSDTDKLHSAVLAEVSQMILKRTCEIKDTYSLHLSPAQAIALRILYTDFIRESTTYVGNRLHQLSNEVHKKYF